VIVELDLPRSEAYDALEAIVDEVDSAWTETLH
jgi:hypothetical protein